MKKVIVVGGGISGLSCGKRLLESGKFDVTLLEASSRIGGRVDTRQFGDRFIENGAQWVHGEKGNKVFEMANSMKLLAVDDDGELKCPEDAVFITNEGKALEKEVHDKIKPLLSKLLLRPDINEVSGSVGEWTIKKFQEEFHLGPLDPNDKRLDGAMLDWIHRFQNNIDGSDNWFQSSIRGHYEFRICAGNPTIAWKSPACYSSLLGIILNDNPSLSSTFQPEIPTWIETDKKVIKIEVQSTEEQPVRVTCSDSTIYSCDHLVATVSLGVLKHCHKNLFCPPLPARKVLAIENLGFGSVNKLHFGFKKKWWPDTIVGFNFLWNDSENVKQYWRSDIDEATLTKNVAGFPLWCRNILGFYRVSSHPTALYSWTTGPVARFIEKMTDEEVKHVFMQVFRHFLKKYEIPDPEEFCRSSWFSNPLTRGSYSFRQVNSENADVWASDLAAPILNESGVPVICFAGEATHDHYFSTVHGAYKTGRREAYRLIKGSKSSS